MQETSDFPSLANHFLVAMPKLQDPNFEKTVTLICEHNKEGAIGIIINRPMETLKLSDILSELEIKKDRGRLVSDDHVYIGGPVHNELGLVLHAGTGDWNTTLRIGPDLGLTSSRDVLESMATGDGPSRALLSLGYAGWAPCQLESEIHQNSWLTVKADPEIIFSIPVDTRWQKAIESMGLNPARLSSQMGHA